MQRNRFCGEQQQRQVEVFGERVSEELYIQWKGALNDREMKLKCKWISYKAASGAFGFGENAIPRESGQNARLVWKMSGKKSGLFSETKQGTENNSVTFSVETECMGWLGIHRSSQPSIHCDVRLDGELRVLPRHNGRLWWARGPRWCRPMLESFAVPYQIHLLLQSMIQCTHGISIQNWKLKNSDVGTEKDWLKYIFSLCKYKLFWF